MPELPEVETIKLSLEKKILGLTIKEIQILNAKSFMFGEKPFDSAQGIKGAKVIKVWRRAKVLGIDLARGSLTRNSSKPVNEQASNEITILFHLKMSGQIIFIADEQRVTRNEQRFVGGHPTKDMLSKMPNSHTRVIFEFSDNSKLYFNDQRKFGWIKVIKSEELGIKNYGYAGNIGPEPLEDTFSWEVLKENLSKHKKTPIKVAILDQTVVAGVGNIYACEACFIAKINPKLKVKDLSDEQIKKLHKAIVSSLRDGIKYGGSTKTHFVDSDGKKGLFLDYANVYNRVGKPCKVCGTKIEKIKLGGRGTFFCINCQK